MKNIYYSFLLIQFISLSALSQPNIEWQKSYGGSMWDDPSSIQQTSDGGFVIAGCSSSIDGYVTGTHTTTEDGMTDIWLVKLNSSGDFEWQKCLGGSKREYANSIKETFDNGFIIGGTTYSTDGDLIGSQPGGDGWLIKLNSQRDIEWQKCFDGVSDVIQVPDSNFIVAGWNLLRKLDIGGNTIWQRTYNGSISSLYPTENGGYVIAGSIAYFDTSMTEADHNYWIAKTDEIGHVEWESNFGGTREDIATSIMQTTDNGFAVAGYSYSNDGDISGHQGGADYWVIKIDSVGNLQWQNSLGGTDDDFAFSLVKRFSGNISICGESNSNNGDVTNHQGNIFNSWIVELNQAGELIWEKSLGRADYATSIIETNESELVVTSWSRSDCNINGGGDYCITKFEAEQPQFMQVNVFPNPSSGSFILEAELGFGGEIRIDVRNILGQTVFSTQEIITNNLYRKDIKIDASSGMYYISFNSEKNSITKKLLLTK